MPRASSSLGVGYGVIMLLEPQRPTCLLGVPRTRSPLSSLMVVSITAAARCDTYTEHQGQGDSMMGKGHPTGRTRRLFMAFLLELTTRRRWLHGELGNAVLILGSHVPAKTKNNIQSMEELEENYWEAILFVT